MRNDNRRAPQKHKASSVRRKRTRRRSNARRRSNDGRGGHTGSSGADGRSDGRQWRRSTGGSGRGASGEEEEIAAGEQDGQPAAQGAKGQGSSGSRRSISDEHTVGAMWHDPVQQTAARRYLVYRPHTQGTSKPYLLTIDAPTGGCVIAAPRYPYWDGHAVRLYNR